MNTEFRLIKLYRIRRFGEKISDTFDFVRENWRPLLKYITYLLLPVALVQSFCMTNFMSGYMEFANMVIADGRTASNLADMASWLLSLGFYTLVQLVGLLLVTSLAYTMMQQYEQRSTRLVGITFADMKPSILRMVGRQMVLIVTGLILIVVIGLLIALMVAISRYFILPAIILAFAVFPIFFMIQPVYLFEKTGIISAYAKSVRLTWKTWAGIVGVVLVLYIIGSILSGLVSTPWYIMMMVKNVLVAQGNTAGFVSSFGYTAIQYLLGVVSSFFGCCILVLYDVGIAYHYGHACDKVDGVSVDQDIENFETL